MAKRKIIEIDDKKCNGCGKCIPNCPEGALQIIDGKARLVSDLFCDGLGACVGNCPTGAMQVIEREAKPYSEEKAMKNISKKGKNTIRAHLKHLKEHGEEKLLEEGIEYLKKHNIEVPDFEGGDSMEHGCPGAAMRDFSNKEKDGNAGGSGSSQLRQWPVQLHLVPPTAPYFQNQDVVLAADCTAYALGDFHKNHLRGKGIAIACPKLDSEQETYKEKLVSMIDNAKINSLTVMTMEVPCCRGLLALAHEAAENAERTVPVKSVVVGIEGRILSEEWI